MNAGHIIISYYTAVRFEKLLLDGLEITLRNRRKECVRDI